MWTWAYAYNGPPKHICADFQALICKLYRKAPRSKLTSSRAAIFFIHVLNRRELKSFRATSQFIWPLIHKYSPSLHLDDLNSPVKSLEGEKSTVLAFYAGAQNAHVGQI